jgi:hypothetical protein
MVDSEDRGMKRVVSYFEVVSRHLPRETVENH